VAVEVAKALNVTFSGETKATKGTRYTTVEVDIHAVHGLARRMLDASLWIPEIHGNPNDIPVIAPCKSDTWGDPEEEAAGADTADV
jgi:hypothetical protein